jgi:hypothetical protein
MVGGFKGGLTGGRILRIEHGCFGSFHFCAG